MESSVCKGGNRGFEVRSELLSLPEQELLLNEGSNGTRNNLHRWCITPLRMPHLRKLWGYVRYIAEIIFKERMTSTAASLTSALFLILPIKSSQMCCITAHKVFKF